MPVLEYSPPERSPGQRKLLADLTAELRRPKEFGQPRVVIRPMPRGGLRHVYVIWDAWSGCPPEVRGEIVREAFAAARGIEFEQSIALAIPATVPEAVEMDLLRYGVRPEKWGRLAEAVRENVTDALLEEGASVSNQHPRPLLRFNTPVEAEAARRRLEARLPDVEWEVSVAPPPPEA